MKDKEEKVFKSTVIDDRPVYLNGRRVTYDKEGNILKVGDMTFDEYEKERKKYPIKSYEEKLVQPNRGGNPPLPSMVGPPSFFFENVKKYFEETKFPTKEDLAKAFGFNGVTWYHYLKRSFPDYTEAVNYIIERLPKGVVATMPKYIEADQFNIVADEYFELCEKGKIPAPSFSGLSYHLGYQTRVNPETFFTDNPDLLFALKRALLRVEKAYEENLTTLKNPVGSIFALKNHGWSDGKDQSYPLVENMLNVLTEAYRRRTENKGNVTNVRSKKQKRLAGREISEGETEP